MKKITLIVCLLISKSSLAYTYEFSNHMRFDINGYLGWRQISSNVDFSSVKSQPELGVATSFKINDQLVIFNQFKYGTNVNDILVYNNIAYTPDIPIDDFQITFKGGKIRFDSSMYNITRINPRTRRGVFQPQSIYWDTMGQTLTSGVGVGFDAKYKNLSLSYVIDKQTSVDSNEEAKVWALTNFATNYQTKFGDHQTLTTEYRIPEYGLRARINFQDFQFTVDAPFRTPVHLQLYGGGIEWTYKDLMLSVEGFCIQTPHTLWHSFSKSFCSLSPLLSYDINDYVSIQANYNQYRASLPPVVFQTQTYSKDLNIGFNVHKNHWMGNAEIHYIQGGRLVNPSDYLNNPNDYKHFWVAGFNAVYYWD